MAGPTIAVTFLLLSLLMKILPLKSQYSLIISSIIKKRQQLLSCFLEVLYYRKQKRSQAEQSAERQVGCDCVVEGDADVCLAKTEVASFPCIRASGAFASFLLGKCSCIFPPDFYFGQKKKAHGFFFSMCLGWLLFGCDRVQIPELWGNSDFISPFLYLDISL